MLEGNRNIRIDLNGGRCIRFGINGHEHDKVRLPVIAQRLDAVWNLIIRKAHEQHGLHARRLL